MGPEPVDSSKIGDIDISPYGEYLAEYVSAIESRICRPIRFLDIATHPEASKRRQQTHVDIGWCICRFPAVWVNRKDIERVRCSGYHLAHEATHVELVFQDYPFEMPEPSVPRAEAEIRGMITSLVQDLVVEERLAKSGFDGSQDFGESLEQLLSEREEAQTYPPPNVKPDHPELLCAIDYASHFLSRYCKSRDKHRLRKSCRTYHLKAWSYVKQIISIVKNVPEILEPEGQGRAIRQITMAFGLDET